MKMQSVIRLITFGDHYLLAVLFYLGFGLIFTAITPGTPSLWAVPSGCGGESTCEAGMVCCGNGTCCYLEDCESGSCGGCGND
jgi:hypothetical protein